MRIDFNNGWLWAKEFDEEMVKPSYEEGNMENVRIPHTVKVTPLNYFDAHEYQMVSCYRKTFNAPEEWKGKKVFITFDAVAHEAEVYINGQYFGKTPVTTLDLGPGYYNLELRKNGYDTIKCRINLRNRYTSVYEFVLEEVKGFINVGGICSPGLTSGPAIAEDVVEILKN